METTPPKPHINLLAKFRYRERKGSKQPDNSNSASNDEPKIINYDTATTNKPNTPFYRSTQGGPLIPTSPPADKFVYPLDSIPILANGLSITNNDSTHSSAALFPQSTAATTETTEPSFAALRSISETTNNKPNERIQMHLAKLKKHSQFQQTTLDTYVKQEPGTCPSLLLGSKSLILSLSR